MHITSSQIAVIVIGIIALILVLSLVKKAVKWVISTVILLVFGVWVGLLSPQQAIDTATAIKDKGIATYQRLADASQNIKVDGENISVRIKDTWFDLNAVNSYHIDGNSVRLSVGGNSYTVTDENIVRLFKTLENR